MIIVDDLIIWAKQEAIGRSATIPCGWISVEALQDLICKIQDVEPMPFLPKKRGEQHE